MAKQIPITPYPHEIVSVYSKFFCDFSEFKGNTNINRCKLIPPSRCDANPVEVFHTINNITELIGDHVKNHASNDFLNLVIYGKGIMPNNIYDIVKVCLTRDYLISLNPNLEYYNISITVTYHLITIEAKFIQN